MSSKSEVHIVGMLVALKGLVDKLCEQTMFHEIMLISHVKGEHMDQADLERIHKEYGLEMENQEAVNFFRNLSFFCAHGKPALSDKLRKSD